MLELPSQNIQENSFDAAILEPIVDLLNDPDFLATRFAQGAAHSAQEIERYLREPGDDAEPCPKVPRPVMSEDLSALLDPNLPTLAIDDNHAYIGSGLVALAARQSASANVIYVPNGLSFGDIVSHPDGGAHLEVTKGWLLAHDGTVLRGDFPEPVVVDVVDTNEPVLLSQLTRHGVPTLHDPAVVATWNNKAGLHERLAGSGVMCPPRHALADLWQTDTNAEYVIKPSCESQGRGIVMFSGIAACDQATKYYNFLEERGLEPLIESRIRSYPLIDPDTGQRLDWNARSLIACGEYVDMYARANNWNSPVNMAAGARRLLLKDLVHYGLEQAVVEEIIDRLQQQSRLIARHVPVALSGLDLAIDENLQAYAYEVNVGNVGGLQTLAELTSGRGAKLANAQRLLSLWTPRITKITPPQDETARHPIEPGWSDRLNIAMTDRAGGELLNALPREAMYALNGSPQQFTHWLNMSRSLLLRQGKPTRELDRLLLEQDPLGVAQDLTRAAMLSSHPKEFLADATVIDFAIPHPRAWSAARAGVHAIYGEFGPMRNELVDAMMQGVSLDQVDFILVEALLNFASFSKLKDMDEPHADILRVFVHEGYTAAKDFGEKYDAGNNSEHARLMRQLRCALAFSNRDFETAIILGDELLAENPEDRIIHAKITKLKNQDLLLPGVIEFRTRAQLARGDIIAAVVDYRDACNQHFASSPERLHALAQLITSDVLASAAPWEQDWLMQALDGWANYVSGQTAEWRLPPRKAETGITFVLTAFWSLERGNPVIASTLMQWAAQKLDRCKDFDLFTMIVKGKTARQRDIAATTDEE